MSEYIVFHNKTNFEFLEANLLALYILITQTYRGCFKQSTKQMITTYVYKII